MSKSGYLLDTHIWIWLQEADRTKLKREALEQCAAWHDAGLLHISHISIWEIANLLAKDRIRLSMVLDLWLDPAFKDAQLHFLSLTPEILVASTQLIGGIHRDPADRMLIATAHKHKLTLLTRDKDILRYAKQGHLSAQKM